MSTLAMPQNRVLSGMRTSGRLHLGHYHGVLKNWLKLQHQYECFFFAADWHALTTDYADPTKIKSHAIEMIIDWLAAGLDPQAAKIFIQSQVPAHAELHLLLSMMTPLSWLERVPSYKDQIQKLKEKDLGTYGFLGYPLLQGADILIYRAQFVPVGEDQVAHIEIVREIARRFNYLYGAKTLTEPNGSSSHEIILTEPQALLTASSKLPGLDGQKMSKSYHNTIQLREDSDSITHKIKTMPTDPARVRRNDPGNPEKCPVWGLHQAYSTEETREWVLTGCRTAGIGCLECKKPVIDAIQAEVAPIRTRALELSQDLSIVYEVVAAGQEAASIEAEKTLHVVRDAMGLNYG